MNILCRCGPRASTRFFASDAAPRAKANDPTGTMPLQRRFSKDLVARWDALRRTVPNFITARTDLATTIGHAAITGQDPVRAFQKWFDTALKMVVVGDGRWMNKYVREAGDAAIMRVESQPDADRIPPLQTLVHIELQGIAEATSQQAVRAFANGLLTRKTPGAIARDVQAIIDKTGKARSDLLVSFIVVRAFGAVTLDALRASGVTHVGIIPERVTTAPSITRDAKPSTKSKTKKPKDLVEVLTAGDDKVCQQCEDISEEGPYTLAEAENLIPAHPRCRCAFVPWDDARFASVHDDKDALGHGSYKNGAYVPPPKKHLDEVLAEDRARWSSVDGLNSWTPPADNAWRDVSGQNSTMFEPSLPELKPGYSFTSKSGNHYSVPGERLSSGIIMREPDGRVWLVKPKNGYGGYDYTWPKGGVEDGLSPQANAIKEMYEESGLKARITGYAGDYRGDTSVTRMYHAIREDGHPRDHGWETESVTLVHPHEVNDFLNRTRDRKIAEHHLSNKANLAHDEFNEGLHPRDKDGKFAHKGFVSKGAENFIKTLKSGDVPHEVVHSTEEGVVVKVMNEHDLPSLELLASSEGDFKHKGSGFAGKYYTFASTKSESAPTAFDPIDMSDLTKVAGKKGSNEGGVYADQTGTSYYIKTPKTLDHVQNELTAAALYKEAGVNTMEYVPVKGGAHVATVLQPLEKDNVAHFTADERHEAQKDFAIHAWLANHDAVGTGGDNQVIVNGKVTTVDTGGSLKYRAQGEPKAHFGNEVTEINTMRDPSKSHDAAALYGNMTNQQMVDSMKRVTDIPNQKISEIVHANMPSASPAEKSALLDKLIARKVDIAAQMEKIKVAEISKPMPATTEPKVFKTKTEHIKHLLMEGTTAENLKSKMGWKAVSMPQQAAATGLKLEITKKNGVNFYKGTPLAAEELKAINAQHQAEVAAAAPAAVITKAPVHVPIAEPLKGAAATLATPDELKKAAKSTKLTAQYVPGAPAGHPEAEKLIDKFNEKYAGKEYNPAELQQKVVDYKKLQAAMVPIAAAHNQKVETEKHATLLAAAAAKAKANEIPEFHDEESERKYWYNKHVGDNSYMTKAESVLEGNGSKAKMLKSIGVTASEVAYVKAFTGSYSHVNANLTKGVMEPGEFAFKHIMNDALDKFPKYDGNKVYRKIGLSGMQQAEYEPGKVVHWRQFSSTSKNNDTWSGNTHFTIHNPKSGVDVEFISSNPSEAEVIMPADTYYLVKSKKQIGGNTHIEMEEVIPFGKKKKKAA